MAPHLLSYWWTPLLMVLSSLAGVLLALGHHLFYKSLVDTPASINYSIMGNQFTGQQLNIAIGTAFAFLVKVAFVLSVSTAYYQIFWRYMKRESTSNKLPTLVCVDTAFSSLDDLISLLTIPLWFRYPILFLMAATAWLLPIASILTPASLSVALKENFLSTSMENIPQIDFSNLDFLATMPNVVAEPPSNRSTERVYRYRGPSQSLSRTALNVAIQKTILPIHPPFSNSSWALDFRGPSIQCVPVDPEKSLQFQRNIATYLEQGSNQYRAPTFLAWYPRTTEGGSTLDDPYIIQNNITSQILFAPDSESAHDQDALIYIAVMPNMLSITLAVEIDSAADNPLGAGGDNATMLQCQLHISTYHALFNYTNGVQNVQIRVLEQGPTAPIINRVIGPSFPQYASGNCTTLHSVSQGLGERCEYDPGLLPQLGHQSVLQAFTNTFDGNLTKHGTYGRVLKGTSRIRSTALSDTEEMAYLTDFQIHKKQSGPQTGYPLYDLQSSLGNLSMTRPEPSHESLADTLEVMFQNFTISLLSYPLFRANYSSPTAPPKGQVTQAITQTVYSYRPDRLWAAYGVAASCTLVSVFIGLAAVISGRSSYNNAFSTIFRVAKAAKLSVEMKKDDLDGKYPLAGYLGKAKIRIGAEETEHVEELVVRGKEEEIALHNDGSSQRGTLLGDTSYKITSIGEDQPRKTQS